MTPAKLLSLLALTVVACGGSTQGQPSIYAGSYRGFLGPRQTMVTATVSPSNEVAALVGGVPYTGRIEGGRIRFAWVDNRFSWNGRRLTTLGVPYLALVRDTP